MERHSSAGTEMTKDRRYIIFALLAVFALAIAAAIYLQSGGEEQQQTRRGQIGRAHV